MDADVLTSWNDGPTKEALVGFVEDSAREGSPGFIPAEERIAAFDNDGTLWVEKPAPVQAGLILSRLMQQVEEDPSLANEEPYRSLINQDEDFLRGLADQEPDAVMKFLKGVGTVWAGTSPDEYESEVREFLAANLHPRFDRPYTDLVYRPMLELFDLLRAYDWRVYVCSGGGRDFMRVIAEGTWGILRENVIGSTPEFVYRGGGMVRENALRGNVALGAGKIEHIYARTGRMPRFSVGNGDVDLEMLEVADCSVVIVHDDAEREYAYTEGAERLISSGKQHGWTFVSMKNDWNTVFGGKDPE